MHPWPSYILLVIKAQIATADDVKNFVGNSLKFPDENDTKLINNTFNGLSAQVLIPNQLLNKALEETSKPIVYMYVIWLILNSLNT